ncbi:MAG: beta-galactosidase trimerization domain-containing protein [Chloroflexota bacterium]
MNRAPFLLRWITALSAMLILLVPWPHAAAQDQELVRILLEAEHFAHEGTGWQAISTGQGNYFVDAIGAAHYSGEQMLRLASHLGPAQAQTTTQIPRAGVYRVWLRYDYPWRDVSARVRVRVEQHGSVQLDEAYGEPNATRLWFFSLPDSPWQDLQYGVEGPVAEAHDVTLAEGPVIISIIGEPLEGGAADRIIDFIYLTTDSTDEFRTKGERLYPLLDEIGRAAPERLYVRITNPATAQENMTLQAQYTLNRAPWRTPPLQIGSRGALRSGNPGALAPGDESPWVNLTCQDTTHPCHLHLRPSGALRDEPIVELSTAPDQAGLLRRLTLPIHTNEMIISIPPYPGLQADRIRTLTETLEPIVAALEAAPPPGRPPRRFPIYAGLGDNVERRIDSADPVSDLFRRLFFRLGANAFNNLNLSALPAELTALRMLGAAPWPFYTYGDYRWNPTADRVEKAQREIQAAGAETHLRGFTLGDEIKLSDWFPSGAEGDALFRAAMRALGESPALLTSAGGWDEVVLDASASTAFRNPRLFVRSRQFQESYALDQLRAGAARIRDTFGADVLIGANLTPHPDFQPDVPLFIRAFRDAGLSRASHSDYWWQASELGPESTGFLLDAFRSGLRDQQGVIQPYVMPHSPGNSDRGIALGIVTSIIHGARAIDLFRIGPEQINTENYIASDDIDRYRALQEALYALGPVEETILNGTHRPTNTALVLLESTDRWEQVSPARGPGIPANTRLRSQASTTERKGLWQALRHAHVPVDMVVESDITDGTIDRYGVLYLAGPQISSSAAQGLSQWVAAGGTLVAVAGAGIQDEFGATSDVLDSALGLHGRTVRKAATFFRPRIEVPRLEALDRVTLVNAPSSGFDAVAWQETLHLEAGTEVLARFNDGSAAIVQHRHGEGRAIVFGTLPGTAYIQTGVGSPPPLPDRGPFMHRPLLNYDPTLRESITRWAAETMPLRPHTSQPLVEIGLIETPSQIVIPLGNFGERDIDVDISVPEAGSVEAVSTVRLGPLPFTLRDGVLTARVRLDLVDYLILYRGQGAG